jgi:hypothetical protein
MLNSQSFSHSLVCVSLSETCCGKNDEAAENVHIRVAWAALKAIKNQGWSLLCACVQCLACFVSKKKSVDLQNLVKIKSVP